MRAGHSLAKGNCASANQFPGETDFVEQGSHWQSLKTGVVIRTSVALQQFFLKKGLN
jgi:hypothetical protein